MDATTRPAEAPERDAAAIYRDRASRFLAKRKTEEERYRGSPFWTVAIAFFIAEMGDKTQLATISLAVQYQTIWTVWMGTTLGMVIADTVGIVVGSLLILMKFLPIVPGHFSGYEYLALALWVGVGLALKRR